MDQIAAAAAVSKQTVYKQFADKQSLFREIVADTVAEVCQPRRPAGGQPPRQR